MRDIQGWWENWNPCGPGLEGEAEEGTGKSPALTVMFVRMMCTFRDDSYAEILSTVGRICGKELEFWAYPDPALKSMELSVILSSLEPLP